MAYVAKLDVDVSISYFLVSWVVLIKHMGPNCEAGHAYFDLIQRDKEGSYLLDSFAFLNVIHHMKRINLN